MDGWTITFKNNGQQSSWVRYDADVDSGGFVAGASIPGKNKN